MSDPAETGCDPERCRSPFGAHAVTCRAMLVDEEGRSLAGRCGRCQRSVDNHDEGHRVTPILRGGRGVECAERGDIAWSEGMPLGRRSC